MLLFEAAASEAPPEPPVAGSSWTNVYNRSRIGPNVFAIRGSRRTHAGLGYPQDVVLNFLLWQAHARGLPFWRYSMGSPVSPWTYETYVAYLDGGIASMAGNFFTGPRGGWIWGPNALRLACYDLHMAQPQFRHDAEEVPSYEDLVAEVIRQARDETAALEAQRKVMRDRLAG